MHDLDPTTRRATFSAVRGGKLRDASGRELAVGAFPVSIGRGTSNELCVDDQAVSAAHCELRATPRGVLLRDLGSTNGTFVGNVAVYEVVLTGPCTIRVGASDLYFEPTAAPVAPDAGDQRDSFGPLVGGSEVMRRIYRVLEQVGSTELSVIVTGETGTGKELVAKALHEASPRAAGPFVVLDCGALPASLAESILFGHEKGAFTGATARSSGAFHNANGGTIFLDELGELPIDLQPKLLRVVAERAVQRVGGRQYEPVDVRVISATRRDLRLEMNAQRFREDLYFRLAQFRVETPPLRDRLEDIPQLVSVSCARVGRPQAASRVTSYIRQRFRYYDWPGNVRELVNVASVLASLGDEVGEEMLPTEEAKASLGGDITAEEFVKAKRRFEAVYFSRMLEATDGNISEISRRCGLARHHVRSHLRKLGLMG